MLARSRRARSLLASAIGLILLAAASCASSGPVPETGSGAAGALRFGTEEYPASFAPGTDNGYAWARVPYETLVTRAPDDPNRIEPLLATSWTVEPTSITFTLRQGVTFHDGAPFDAAAAKANLEFVRDQAGPFSAGLAVIDSIETPDPATLVLHLSAPTQSLLSTLTGRAGVMASPAALRDGTLDDHPVGTGPWAYDPSLGIPGVEIGFTRYPGYWDPDGVGLDQLVLVAIDDTDARLDALRTGEIDLGDVNLEQADEARTAGVELATVPGVHYSLIFFDRGPGGAVADPEVRRAICRSIDSEGLASLGGSEFLTATDQRFEAGDYGHSSAVEPLGYDPAGARPALAGIPPLTMLAYEQNQPFAEAIAGGLGEVGVDLGVQIVTASQYFTGWYDGSHSVGFGDNSEFTPEAWYRTWFAADAPNNPSGVESPELAAAAAAALAETDSAAAEPLWANVMTQIWNESLQCNDVIVNQAVGWLPGRVDGVTPVEWEANSVLFENLRMVG